MLRRVSYNEGCDAGVCVDSLWASFLSLLCPLFSFPSLMQLLAQTKGVLLCRSQEQPKLSVNCAAFCVRFALPATSRSCRLIGEQILETAVDKRELNSNPACIPPALGWKSFIQPCGHLASCSCGCNQCCKQGSKPSLCCQSLSRAVP